MPTAGGAALAPAQPVPVSATITADTANHVIVNAGIGPNGGYLVLLDSFSDDWRATADGLPAPIVRANGLFLAVRTMETPKQVEHAPLRVAAPVPDPK